MLCHSLTLARQLQVPNRGNFRINVLKMINIQFNLFDLITTDNNERISACN